MKIILAPELEKALLRAISEGVAPPDIVALEELSKEAKPIYESIHYLLKKRAKPPLKPSSILVSAASIFGVPKEDARGYLRSFKELETGAEISAILNSARDKTTLVKLINAAGAQLAKGSLDVSEISRYLNKNSFVLDPIRPVAERLKGKLPKTPRGTFIPSLPYLSEITKGLYGVWAIGGEPGLGKSTLGWQIALDLGQTMDVIYYDLDGTGYEWHMDHTRQIVQGNTRKLMEFMRNFHLRESIKALDEDLQVVKPPALLVVDSFQTLPTAVKYKKEGYDDWVSKFKEIAKKGYRVIFISEMNRATYGDAKMSGYKGTGDIEYGVTVGIQLVGDEADDDLVKLHLVKNRHGKKKGYVIDLERDPKKVFWFDEEAR